MSFSKRPIDWLDLPGLGNANKRPKSPAPLALSSASNSSQPQSTQQNIAQVNPPQLTPNHPPQTAPPSVSSAQPRAPVPGHGNKTAHAMLSTLKSSMKILQKTGKIFPPLQSATDTLLEVLEAIEVTNQGSEKLRAATLDLHEWAVALSSYLTSSQPQQMSECIQQLIRNIEKQAERIRDEQRRGKMMRLVESGQEPVLLETCYRHIEDSFRRLQESRLEGLKPAHDARYDSTFSTEVERGECLANTRVPVLEGIHAWIRGDSGTKIHWTNGMAGTGKTTIAYSVCTGLERDGRLGASFFCSRASPECRDVNRILPTIAYQLAEQFYPFRSSLCRVLGEQPSIGRRNITVQFDHLINIPMLEVKDLLPNGLVVVVDALDECSNPKAVDMILGALFSHAANLPVRFFLTSRPEPSITKTMFSRNNQSRSILHLHNVEEQFVKADIETYLTVKMASLSLNRDQIKQLVECAGILFIYAATVARYLLEASSSAYAFTRLQSILTQRSQGTTIITQDIDMLYRTILGGVFRGRLERDEIELIRRVLWTAVCAREPVTKGTLAILLDTSRDLVTAALQPLQSVLHVSESSEVVSTLRASFPEFLLSSERCGVSIWCDEKIHNEFMAKRCFKVMEEQLRFNICRLDTSSRYDKDVTDLDDRIKAFVSAELTYACRYWSSHLCRSPVCDKLIAFLNQLLEVRLLFWMEVLNLTGWISNVRSILSETDEWLSGTTFSNISSLVKDAYSFATGFAANLVRQSTPHIYISALALCPKQSRVWKIYSKRVQRSIAVDGTLASQRGRTTRWKVDCTVKSMAYSSDGGWIVFGTDEGDIHIWDAYNCAPLREPFKTRTGGIFAIALSPDNSLVVFGSGSGEVGVLHTSNGTPFQSPFTGHTEAVTSVAFSPDGTQIASSSWDGTARVWDVCNGTLVRDLFDCHSIHVNCVAFSPNGTLLACGCGDCMVRVWDIYSGTLFLPPFEGHVEECYSVAFSPDGTRIVSGSLDGTVRIWDARTGTPVCGPLQGAGSSDFSVAFTPDGARILSAPSDHMFEVWDAYSGTLVDSSPVLDTYEFGYDCVAFSPNGTHAAGFSWAYDYKSITLWEAGSSSSTDISFQPHAGYDACIASSADFTRIATTIREPGEFGEFSVLDSRTGVPIPTSFKGQTGNIRTLVLSPNGSCIISASDDCTVREWDVSSGTLISTPFAGIDTVQDDITYSPDGTYLLALGRDKRIRLWDLQQGRLINAPSQGHNIAATALSPNGAHIASGSSAGMIEVWDAHSGALVGNPFGCSSDRILWIMFSSNGALVAVSNESYTVGVWEVQTGTLLSRVSVNGPSCVCAVFLSDDSRLALASVTGVHVWEVDTGALTDTIVEGDFEFTASFRHLVNDDHLGLVGEFEKFYAVWRFPVHSQPSSPLPRMLDIDGHGWVVDPDSEAPIFWLPAELRGGCDRIATPNTLLILPSGTFSFDFSNVLIGESWEQCYSS